VIRAAMLGVTMVVAIRFMGDLGFKPERGLSPTTAVRNVIRGSIDGGFRNPPVRWLMLAAPFSLGAGIFVFYAAQPYLLQLYGDKTAYGVAGLAAAIVAGVQIAGGLIVSRVRRLFGRRTTALLVGGVLNVVLIVLLGLTGSFVVALLLLAGWSFVFAVESPLRQAFINGLIPSDQRATVLSFDSLMGSAGGVIAQPALGRVSDVNGYGAAYLVSAGVQALALPFVFLARREHASSDPIARDDRQDPRTAPRPTAGPVPIDGD
jgi:MFS family permease